MSATRRDRLEQFVDEEYETPETTDEAYNFGKMGAIGRRGRLNREQFFRHDPWPRPYGRDGVWTAYRKGYDEGRRVRSQLDERNTLQP